MKKYILFLFIALWISSFYSCSDPVLNNPFESEVDIPPDTAVPTSALRFHPLYKEVSKSSQFTMDIYVHEVTSLIGAEIEFTYDNSLLSFDMAEKGSLLSSDDVLIPPEHNSETGTVLLTLSTAQDEGVGITGSGSIVKVYFTPIPDLAIYTGADLNFTDNSLFIQSTAPTITISFSGLINAGIWIE